MRTTVQAERLWLQRTVAEVARVQVCDDAHHRLEDSLRCTYISNYNIILYYYTHRLEDSLRALQRRVVYLSTEQSSAVWYGIVWYKISYR